MATTQQEETATQGLQPKKGWVARRLVVTAIPYQGHLNPMIQLANLLDSKGFTIIFLLTKSTPLDQSKYPNIQFRRIPEGLPVPDGAIKVDIARDLTQLNTSLVEPFRECLVDLLSEEEEESITCLISDANLYCTQQVADELKLPRIAFRMSSVSSFLAFDALPIFIQKGYFSGYKPEDEVVEFPPLKVKDIPMVPNVSHEVFGSYIENMVRTCKQSSALIFNTFIELEGNEFSKLTHSFGVKTFAIGPLHKYFSSSSSSLLKQDRSAISWLDTQAPKSVVYVSFGSIAEMKRTDMIELSWGLINSDQPFLLVIRHNNSDWLHNLPDCFMETVDKRRGYIVNWAPQQEVLAHPAVGLFWTHSGWNSITESLCEGVPMICTPFFADQLVNSRFVNDVWKVGLSLEKGFDRVEIEGAIRKVMVEKESEVRSRVAALKEDIDSCVQQGGSSCQSLQSLIDYIVSLDIIDKSL